MEKMNLKQFAKNYKLTDESYKTYQKVTLFFELEDIKVAFDEHISYATFDDLNEDELTNILSKYRKYVAENGSENYTNAIAQIVKETTDFEDRLKYMNLSTGEVMTERAMRKQFRDDYDGDDPTNSLTWEEYYKRI